MRNYTLKTLLLLCYFSFLAKNLSSKNLYQQLLKVNEQWQFQEDLNLDRLEKINFSDNFEIDCYLDEASNIENSFTENFLTPTIQGISANDDLASTTSNNSIEINVLCNDFELTNQESLNNLILGKWKFSYATNGFGPIIYADDNNYATLYFTEDSLFTTANFDDYPYYTDFLTYEGSYNITGDTTNYYPFNPFVVFDSSSNFYNDNLIISVSDSSLLLDDGIAYDGPGVWFVPVDDIFATIIQNGSFGNAVVNSDGNIIYTPNVSTNEIDTITYLACNNLGLCDSAYLIINIESAIVTNNPPIANDDFIEIMGYPTEFLYILSNDIDPDGDSLTITILDYPSCGTLTLNNQDLSFTFEDDVYCSFTYQICDPFNECDTAIVMLQYFCYPWDFPVDYIYDTINLNETATLALHQVCFEDSTEYVLNENPSNIQINFSEADKEITFLNYYVGTDTISYTTTFIDEFGCIACGSVIYHVITFDFTNNFNSNFYETVKIYPNPVSNYLNIDLENNEIEQGKIFNISGKIVKEFNNQKQVDVSNLSAGNYFLQIETQNGKVLQSKFLKQ